MNDDDLFGGVVESGNNERVVAVDDGTEEEFRIFFETNWASSLSMIVMRFGRLPTAEEATQNAFLQLHRNWSKVDSPKAWLRRAVAHEIVRTEGVWKRLMPISFDETLIDRYAVSQDHAAIRQRLREIWTEVQGLPTRERQVMVLHVEGWSHQEIAQRLGIKDSTVRTTLNSARNRLRPLLGPDGGIRRGDEFVGATDMIAQRVDACVRELLAWLCERFEDHRTGEQRGYAAVTR